MAKKVEIFVKLITYLVPILVFSILFYVIYQKVIRHGPMIKVDFSEAHSIQIAKTKVKYKGVEVGLVENIKLNTERKLVEVYIRLFRDYEAFANKESQFWLVKPNVSVHGVQGFETLFQGQYIKVKPGLSSEQQNEFVANGEYMTDEDEDDRIFLRLRTDFVNTLDIGDPLTFRGKKVGYISKIKIDSTGRYIDVNVAIYSRYANLFRASTVFWIRKAIKADLGLFSSKIELGSFDSMMTGGLAAATPRANKKITEIKDHIFWIKNEPEKWKEWAPNLEE
ncbi:MAG: MlaD family protein [Oligoflexia bacterium]|nr:MlaD family protein [Oligoflexia bacterium]